MSLAAARAASPAITRLAPSFTSHLPRLDAAPSESSTEARIPSSSPPVGVQIIRRGRPSLSAARLTGDSPHGEALLAAVCRRSPRPESFTCRGLPSIAAGPRLASESLAGRTGIRPSRVSHRGGRRVTHRSPTPDSLDGRGLAASAIILARRLAATVTGRGVVRVTRRGQESLAAARVRVTRCGLPSLAAAQLTGYRHGPMSLATVRLTRYYSPRPEWPESLELASSGLQSFRLAAAPVTPGLQGPVLLATARASQVRVTHRGRSHSPRPEVNRRGPSPGHSGAAARRHSARPGTGNRSGPPLLAAARRHSPRPAVRVTATHRGSPRPHSPRPASLAAARVTRRGPSH